VTHFYMHVDLYCMLLAPMIAGMDLNLAPQMLPNALDDAAVDAQKAAVRALLVKRLEGLWEVADEELDGGKDRVRWAELQLRIVDRLAKLYRMDGVLPSEPAPDDSGADQQRLRLAVSMQLDDVAAKAAAS
jgi:hypothetical protein